MAFVTFILVALTIQPAPATVTVRAVGDCPSTAAVDTELVKMLGSAPGGRAPDIAEVAVVGSTLTISLRRASGELIADKRLPAEDACAARATAAAIVVAAWEAQLGDHAGTLLAPPVTPPPIADAIPAARTSAPPPSPLPSVPLAAPTLVGGPNREPPIETHGWVLAPGGSLLASIDAGNAALAVTAEVALSRIGSGLALGAGALFVSTHSTSVSPGSGSWRRFGVVIDGRRRIRWSRLWLEGRAGAALTVLYIDGSGLAENAGGRSFDPGILGALRLGLAGGPGNPWLEVGTTVWPRRQTLDVRGGGAADLPSVDAILGIGFSLERQP